MKPSWRRRFLVWYIDAWPVHGVVYATASIGEIEKYSWPIAIGVLVFLEWMLGQLRIPSFGDYALGIRKTSEGDVVDEELRSNVHWVIVLVATLEWLGAWRYFGRAVGSYPFYYLAGIRLAGLAGKFVAAAFAIGLAWAALAVYRCKRYAIPAALAVASLLFANDLAGGQHTRDLLDWFLVQRAAERGRPLAFGPSSAMWMLAIGHSVNLLMIGMIGLFLRKRFRYSGPVWEEWRSVPDEQHYQLP